MNRKHMRAGAVSASDQLKSDIDELVPGMVALRRDLHTHPELAYEEVRTSGIVAQRLHGLGLEVQADHPIDALHDSFFEHEVSPTPSFFSELEEKFHVAGQRCLALA